MSGPQERRDDAARGEDLGIGDLACPGCWGPVVDRPPLGWPGGAGESPDFSHTDGTVLCPDERGRVPEPVDAGGLRYQLTDAGDAASLDEDLGRGR
ncbi:hypothetical protein [Pseudonocardia phyllosphaerae]|uniref:hypothetical protein n=1 Tax=Pseudonocardia phyllosphaerae TaxID=3390502 RepID=UPI00397941CE